MSKTNSVADFLSDLTDAVKAKKGSSDTINAQDLPGEIINLPFGQTSSLTFETTTNLVQHLTNIADAIRAKKGTTGTISAQDFATEVANLPSSMPSPSDLTSTARLTAKGTSVTVSIASGKEAYALDTSGNVFKVTTTSTLIYEGGTITNPDTGATTTAKVYCYKNTTTLYFTTNWGMGWGAAPVTVNYLIQ